MNMGQTSFNTRVLIATLQCNTLLKEFVTCMDINSYRYTRILGIGKHSSLGANSIELYGKNLTRIEKL